MIISKRSSVGVDIGNSAIKIVRFSGKKIVRAAVREIPRSLRSGPPEELVSFTGNALVELARENSLRGSFAVTNLLAPDKVQMLSFPLPELSRSDMRGAVEFKIKKSSAAEIANRIYDYYVSGVSEGGSRKMVAVVADGNVIHHRIRQFRDAGLNIKGFLTTGFALESLLNHFNFLSPEENTLFIDIGASTTSLNIFQGKNLVMSHEMFFGSDDISRAMCRPVKTEEGNIGISPEQADSIKKECEILEADSSKIWDKIPSSSVAALVRPEIERLSKEITRLINQFRQGNGDAVSRIFLCGGGAGLKGLAGFIMKNTGIETSNFNLEEVVPLGVSGEDKQVLGDNSFDFSVACGLALCGIPRVDLVPGGAKILQQISNIRNGAIVSCVIAAMVLGGYHASVLRRIDEYGRLVSEGRAKLEPLEEKTEFRHELLELRQKVEETESFYRDYSRQPSFHGIFKELTHITPGNIRLERMKLGEDGNLLTLHGRFVSAAGELSPFLVALEESPFFHDVSLVSRTTDADGGVKFEITCKLLY